MRPEALQALLGVELILHAGDVGTIDVVRELETIAPVRAVRGNVDDETLGLPDRLRLDLEGVSVHISHGNELGSPAPDALVRRYRADVIVYGHTHRARVEHVGCTLVVNPGAAGPRRFNLQPSVALLEIVNCKATVKLIPLARST